MAEPNQNPFAGLITTTGLRQSREAAAVQQAGDNPWLRMSAQAGLRIQEALLDKGIGLQPEDYRAQRNDKILGKAANDYNKEVSDGRLDPVTAMQRVTEDVYQQLLSAGDVKSAATIAPHIYRMRQEQSELDKLEGGNLKTAADTRATDENTSYIKATKESTTNLQSAQAEEARARADLLRRTDPNLRKTGGGLTGATNNQLGKFREQGAQVRGFIQNAGTLYDLYMKHGGIGANPTGYLATIQDAVNGARDLIFADPNRDHQSDLTNETSLQKRYARAVDVNAKTLNVDRGQYESVVTQLAYQLAIANNGTRPTDKDFANALVILGASQDPSRAAAVLKDNIDRARRNFINLSQANPVFKGEDVVGQVNEEYDNFLGHIKTGGPGRGITGATPGIAPGPGAAGANEPSIDDLANKYAPQK